MAALGRHRAIPAPEYEPGGRIQRLLQWLCCSDRASAATALFRRRRLRGGRRSWAERLIAVQESGGIMVRTAEDIRRTTLRTIVVRLAKHWPSLLSLKLQPNGCLYA